jgi:ferric-dicitrate binding protein FerR (iron transport regulator)
MDSSPETQTIPAALLDRYLAGACSAEDAARVEAWASVHDLGETLAALKGAASPTDTHRTAADWAVIVQRTSEQPSASGLVRPSRSSRNGALGRRLGIAAAALGLGVALVVAGRTVIWPRATSPATPIATFATAVGQQAMVTLDDGTRVTLAPQTTLRVERGFGGRSRHVSLDGQAYFDVARADGAPFVIQTGRVTTRVLGTAFVVRRYARDTSVRVAVRTGKVMVSSEGAKTPSVTLTAGLVGAVNDSIATLVPVTDLAQDMGWLDGKLVFNSASASDVLEALTRWYGYQFKLADSTLARRKLRILLSTRSSSDALASLRLVLNVDLAFNGNVVTLTPRRASGGVNVRDDVVTHTREVGR